MVTAAGLCLQPLLTIANDVKDYSFRYGDTMKKTYFITAIIFLLLTLCGHAVEINWSPVAGTTTNRWCDSDSWTGGVPNGGPNGDYVCLLRVSGAADCILNTTCTVTAMRQGVNGPGGVLRIIDGGNLTSGIAPDGSKTWSSVGYNNTGHTIVEAGGVFNTADHLMVAYGSDSVATLTINGGTVNVGNVLGVGFSGGTGYVEVNAGALNVVNWNTTDSVKGDSNLNITGGTVRITGDRRNSVSAMVADGRITGYGVGANVVVQYDAATNKTILTAIGRRSGDLDGDGDVDLDDLRTVSDNWLMSTQILPCSATRPVVKDADWWLPRHQDILNQISSGDVDMIFIGDSITNRWSTTGLSVWNQYYANRKAVNMGFEGDRTENVLWRLDHGEIDGISPKLAVIMIGTNNGNDNAEHVAEGILAICRRIRTKCPTTKILLMAIFPRGEYPSSLREKNLRSSLYASGVLADDDMVMYQDIGEFLMEPDGTITTAMMPDFLHPNLPGYQIWAREIEGIVSAVVDE